MHIIYHMHTWLFSFVLYEGRRYAYLLLLNNFKKKCSDVLIFCTTFQESMSKLLCNIFIFELFTLSFSIQHHAREYFAINPVTVAKSFGHSLQTPLYPDVLVASLLPLRHVVLEYLAKTVRIWMLDVLLRCVHNHVLRNLLTLLLSCVKPAEAI